MSQTSTGTSRLNIYLQAHGRLTALSWLESCSGPAHERMWTCVCKINGVPRGEGTAPQKHAAKNIAADIAWAYLVGASTSSSGTS
ncbi:hypothetical protein JR316_0000420 [Psilocybe cubensis]|uniref:DRBM domain-containing protein n=2 Tax=Psilocybe cubensis TaxID=181762 RepID=A0A8H7Y9X0_PSICU|nr:hypothetical protein JR316_0000420 [Psilocybe cubensis]KAH9486356.1 hypothetical protein JR316_0000420 [Psilocybe cubensis]